MIKLVVMEISAGCWIVNEKGEVLLVHPTNSGWFGTLGIPKGWVEKGKDKTYMETAFRETREETGLDVFIMSYLGHVEYKRASGKVYKRVYAYIAMLKDPSLITDGIIPKNMLQLEEVDWARFVNVDDKLVQRKMIKAQRDFIPMYHEWVTKTFGTLQSAVISSAEKSQLKQFSSGDNDASLLIVVDIQPMYRSNIGFNMGEFTEYLEDFDNILYFYNGVDTVGDDSEEDLAYWLLEHDLPEEKLDDIVFVDKGYAFFRAWMDEGVDDDDILRVLRYMREEGINDSRDIEENKLRELMDGEWYPEFDPLVLPFDPLTLIHSYDNATIIGGSEYECLEELTLLFRAYGIEYEKDRKFIYSTPVVAKKAYSSSPFNMKKIRKALSEGVGWWSTLKEGLKVRVKDLPDDFYTTLDADGNKLDREIKFGNRRERRNFIFEIEKKIDTQVGAWWKLDGDSDNLWSPEFLEPVGEMLELEKGMRVKLRDYEPNKHYWNAYVRSLDGGWRKDWSSGEKIGAAVQTVMIDKKGPEWFTVVSTYYSPDDFEGIVDTDIKVGDFVSHISLGSNAVAKVFDLSENSASVHTIKTGGEYVWTVSNIYKVDEEGNPILLPKAKYASSPSSFSPHLFPKKAYSSSPFNMKKIRKALSERVGGQWWSTLKEGMKVRVKDLPEDSLALINANGETADWEMEMGARRVLRNRIVKLGAKKPLDKWWTIKNFPQDTDDDAEDSYWGLIKGGLKPVSEDWWRVAAMSWSPDWFEPTGGPEWPKMMKEGLMLNVRDKVVGADNVRDKDGRWVSESYTKQMSGFNGKLVTLKKADHSFWPCEENSEEWSCDDLQVLDEDDLWQIMKQYYDTKGRGMKVRVKPLSDLDITNEQKGIMFKGSGSSIDKYWINCRTLDGEMVGGRYVEGQDYIPYEGKVVTISGTDLNYWRIEEDNGTEFWSPSFFERVGDYGALWEKDFLHYGAEAYSASPFNMKKIRAALTGSKKNWWKELKKGKYVKIGDMFRDDKAEMDANGQKVPDDMSFQFSDGRKWYSNKVVKLEDKETIAGEPELQFWTASSETFNENLWFDPNWFEPLEEYDLGEILEKGDKVEKLVTTMKNGKWVKEWWVYEVEDTLETENGLSISLKGWSDDEMWNSKWRRHPGEKYNTEALWVKDLVKEGIIFPKNYWSLELEGKKDERDYEVKKRYSSSGRVFPTSFSPHLFRKKAYSGRVFPTVFGTKKYGASPFNMAKIRAALGSRKRSNLASEWWCKLIHKDLEVRVKWDLPIDVNKTTTADCEVVEFNHVLSEDYNSNKGRIKTVSGKVKWMDFGTLWGMFQGMGSGIVADDWLWSPDWFEPLFFRNTAELRIGDVVIEYPSNDIRPMIVNHKMLENIKDLNPTFIIHEKMKIHSLTDDEFLDVNPGDWLYYQSQTKGLSIFLYSADKGKTWTFGGKRHYGDLQEVIYKSEVKDDYFTCADSFNTALIFKGREIQDIIRVGYEDMRGMSPKEVQALAKKINDNNKYNDEILQAIKVRRKIIKHMKFKDSLPQFYGADKVGYGVEDVSQDMLDGKPISDRISESFFKFLPFSGRVFPTVLQGIGDAIPFFGTKKRYGASPFDMKLIMKNLTSTTSGYFKVEKENGDIIDMSPHQDNDWIIQWIKRWINEHKFQEDIGLWVNKMGNIGMVKGKKWKNDYGLKRVKNIKVYEMTDKDQDIEFYIVHSIDDNSFFGFPTDGETDEFFGSILRNFGNRVNVWMVPNKYSIMMLNPGGTDYYILIGSADYTQFSKGIKDRMTEIMKRDTPGKTISYSSSPFDIKKIMKNLSEQKTKGYFWHGTFQLARKRTVNYVKKWITNRAEGKKFQRAEGFWRNPSATIGICNREDFTNYLKKFKGYIKVREIEVEIGMHGNGDTELFVVYSKDRNISTVIWRSNLDIYLNNLGTEMNVWMNSDDETGVLVLNPVNSGYYVLFAPALNSGKEIEDIIKEFSEHQKYSSSPFNMVKIRKSLLDRRTRKSWSTIHGDMQRTGRSGANVSDTVSLKWYFESKYNIHSSPVIGKDGTIYFGTLDGVFHALNSDSTEKWRFQAPIDFITNEPSSKAIYSTATIGDDAIYFGCDNRVLYVLNFDGSKEWEYLTSSEIKGSPAIGEKGIYFSNDETLYAVDFDGKERWRVELGLRCLVAFKDDRLYAGCDDGYLYVYNEDKTETWKKKVNPFKSGFMPVVTEDRVYALTSDGLTAFDLEGLKMWGYKKNTIVHAPAVGDDGMVYAVFSDETKNDGLTALTSGLETWKFDPKDDFGEDIIASPVVDKQGIVYVLTGGTLYAIDGRDVKFVSNFNPQTKLKAKWEVAVSSIDEDISTSIAIGGDGTLYFGYGSKLYAFGEKHQR